MLQLVKSILFNSSFHYVKFLSFEQVDDMIKAGVDICGEYVWKRYDILVLPASFPYGGMENPCLTFATPTIVVSCFNRNELFVK